jgi:hypothetical protein
MNLSKLSSAIAILAFATSTKLSAVSLVVTSDPGFYNNSLGNLLNLTNGGNTSAGYFPTTDDSSVNFPIAPDLSTVSAQLGNWLTNPLALNSNWHALTSIPNNWAVGTEVGIIYQFDTLGATNVVANFGVDNGIFAWLDGQYLGGARRGGGVVLGEHVFNIGNLNAGSHFLQLLLEDHGGSNGYAVNITADTFTPGPVTPQSVPDSAGIVVYLLGFGTLAMMRGLRRR